MGGDSFIMFNLIATVLIFGMAMFAYFKGKRMRYPAVVLASITVVMYVLTFTVGKLHLFDRMSIIYALFLMANIVFVAVKRANS